MYYCCIVYVKKDVEGCCSQYAPIGLVEPVFDWSAENSSALLQERDKGGGGTLTILLVATHHMHPVYNTYPGVDYY